MKWFYFNLKGSSTNTSVMHVLLTFHETNASLIFPELLVMQDAFCSLSITVLACPGL